MKNTLVNSVRNARRGFTLIECLAAAAVLMVAMGLVVKMVGWVVVERRAATQKLWAQQEAANTMERISMLPYVDLTAEALASSELSESARQVLPDGRMEVDVADVDGPPPAKRVSVLIRWRNRAGDYVAPVRLTHWVFSAEATP